MLKTSTLNRRKRSTQSRFEIKLEHGIAFIEYSTKANEIILYHSFIPIEDRGNGMGTKLVKRAIDSFVKRGYKIVPTCKFIQHFIDENPQYHQFVSRWVA